MTQIFTFGSNLRGAHGKGAALFALKNHHARYGQGEGMQGYSYAIPTKDERLNTLPLSEIEIYVKRFIEYAIDHPEYTFNVTPIGCGLAGHKLEDIAPMFIKVPKNVLLPEEFTKCKSTSNEL